MAAFCLGALLLLAGALLLLAAMTSRSQEWSRARRELGRWAKDPKTAGGVVCLALGLLLVLLSLARLLR